MDTKEWYDERDNRTIRYAARRLDHSRWIAITVSPAYLRRFDGQAAVLTAASLFSRMTPSVALAFDDVPIHPALPWAGQSLHEVALAQMRAADPHGRFSVRDRLAEDYWLHLGPDGAPSLVHGSGWNVYIGSRPSPLPEAEEFNCFGAALAAVLAASQIFAHEFAVLESSYICNALDWHNEAIPVSPYPIDLALGDVWVIGAGSVGTATLYFLTLATRNLSAAVIDHDRVKLHNLDRSPIFVNADVGRLKVEATRGYLQGVGVREVRIDPLPLHESRLWRNRQPGQPDLVIAAANEMKVRYYIEAGFPPTQIYATTGQNWQVAAIRHEPFGSACSLCLFPADQVAGTTACATAPAPAGAEKVDAALPFLSFAAGLMTAAESVKRLLPGYPFSADRVVLNTRPAPILAAAPLVHRPACYCEKRNANIYRTMLRRTG